MPSPLETSKKVKPLLQPTDKSNIAITSFVCEKITTTCREGNY